jgi:hypothetical protein
MTSETKRLVELVVKHLNDYADSPGFVLSTSHAVLSDYLIEAEFAAWSEQRGYYVRVPKSLMENPKARCNCCYEYRNYHVNHCTCEF